jgi:hypothetical protein
MLKLKIYVEFILLVVDIVLDIKLIMRFKKNSNKI